VLTLKAAKAIAAAPEAEANKRGSTVAIAIVDDGGPPPAPRASRQYAGRERRCRNRQGSHGLDFSPAKQRLRGPNYKWANRFAGVAWRYAASEGTPILVEGKVIGAIGVSGNTPQEDEEVAKAGTAAAGGEAIR
jgi:glc operon protein GlcG